MIANVEKYTTSVADMKALGFCVSKAHAKFMADFFNRHAIPAKYIRQTNKLIVS